MNNEPNSVDFTRPPYDFVCDYLRKSLTTAMLSLDSSGIITEVNPFICQQLFQESLVGTNIRDLLQPENRSLFASDSPVSTCPLVLSFERQGYSPLLLFSHVYPGDNGYLVIGEQARLGDDQILRKISLLNNELTTLSRESRHETRHEKMAKQNLQEQAVHLNSELSETEKKFRLLADHTYDWEYWINTNGDYEYITPSCERITGYTAEEFMSDPQLLYRIVSDQDTEIIREHFKPESIDQTGLCRLEFIIMTKAGQERWLEHHCFPIFDEQGKLIGRRGNNRDITERKREEAKALTLEEQLTQKHKIEALGTMAGGMAHNFNNNLSIILGNIELSKMKMPPSPEIDNYLSNAKIAVLRSRDLIQQILTYSRQGDREKTSTRLPLIIDETLQLLRPTLPATINLQQEIRKDCHDHTINADSSQIQECLINLCNNAMHAMEEKGDLTISLDSIELQKQDIPVQYSSQPGQYAKLSVKDTGSGMSAETVDKIFDLFFTTKPVDEGTGVGLSTVQGIVSQHGGLIKVNSTLGEGTTFELYFPVIEQTEMTETTSINEDIPAGTEHILFVDDEPMLASLGEMMLKQMGYQVTMMTDSSEALKLFTANADRIDLVITDQTMPELTGKELIQKLKEIKADIPTIICTGYSSKLDEDIAKELGASAYMMKPMDMPILMRTVRDVLDRAKE